MSSRSNFKERLRGMSSRSDFKRRVGGVNQGVNSRGEFKQSMFFFKRTSPLHFVNLVSALLNKKTKWIIAKTGIKSDYKLS